MALFQVTIQLILAVLKALRSIFEDIPTAPVVPNKLLEETNLITNTTHNYSIPTIQPIVVGGHIFLPRLIKVKEANEELEDDDFDDLPFLETPTPRSLD
ncbi:hypothetical protein C8F04DRAFT_1267021 [Mycena alexandri]|uniref:Uncharacterized protein n=1 Tax=Mycena alexandri TaxID=1745969 RepID=A0AAD6SH85_9AGAR|nr:hypothetical protein C8F04DRAFT_1267021 [Mycena alexandri]